jgi:hypothetical protein
MPKVLYEKFEPLQNATLALNYLTRMVDERQDYLPFWLIAAHENPAFARHCRVDDAELVASWYEAIVAVQQMLGTEEGAEVRDGFRRHVLKHWGPHDLRYHEYYPWSQTNHSSFHEMAYILSALNRMIRNDPGDTEAERRASALVRGMRGMVIHRKTMTFWGGDVPIEEKLYEFPNDVYLRKEGWDMTCHTGRGEQAIRNGMMLHALADRIDLTGDEAALDLAEGLANFILGPSRYFNWKMEFFGHIHSAVWVASGLARLGRITRNKRYVEKAQGIYEYVRSLSSSFGWVPEYAQWHPMTEEHCETCCIKDMIQCAVELIDAGFDQYWTDVTRFSRNQLVENQVKDGCFVAVDNTLEDTDERTYQDIDLRIVGGFSGGSEPNSVSLTRFRSIAGCCVGTAPQALQIVWDRAVDYRRGRLTVNIPVDKTIRQGEVSMGYPNEGVIAVTPKRKCTVAIRIQPWMGRTLEARVAGRKRAVRREGDLAVFPDVQAGTTVELRHPLRTRRVTEEVRGSDFTALWRGPDVVDLLPHGKPLRLYQRVAGKKKNYPKAPKKRTGGSGFSVAPTQQKG